MLSAEASMEKVRAAFEQNHIVRAAFILNKNTMCLFSLKVRKFNNIAF
jgi:hypothetical protein